MQMVRAAMALDLKDTLEVMHIEKIDQRRIAQAIEVLRPERNIQILGNPKRRLSILTFNIRYRNGYLHQRFVSALLNDLFGIQS
ncbi:hypothetical protein EPK97_09320 [Chengkuizengella sediminis]|nr:hypothetical protein [Chengkuizengella sediminis]